MNRYLIVGFAGSTATAETFGGKAVDFIWEVDGRADMAHQKGWLLEVVAREPGGSKPILLNVEHFADNVAACIELASAAKAAGCTRPIGGYVKGLSSAPVFNLIGANGPAARAAERARIAGAGLRLRGVLDWFAVDGYPLAARNDAGRVVWMDAPGWRMSPRELWRYGLAQHVGALEWLGVPIKVCIGPRLFANGIANPPSPMPLLTTDGQAPKECQDMRGMAEALGCEVIGWAGWDNEAKAAMPLTDPEAACLRAITSW